MAGLVDGQSQVTPEKKKKIFADWDDSKEGAVKANVVNAAGQQMENATGDVQQTVVAPSVVQTNEEPLDSHQQTRKNRQVAADQTSGGKDVYQAGDGLGVNGQAAGDAAGTVAGGAVAPAWSQLVSPELKSPVADGQLPPLTQNNSPLFTQGIGSPLVNGDYSQLFAKPATGEEPAETAASVPTTYPEFMESIKKPNKTMEQLEQERERADRTAKLTRGLKSLANLFTTNYGGVNTYNRDKDKAEFDSEWNDKRQALRQEWNDYYNSNFKQAQIAHQKELEKDAMEKNNLRKMEADLKMTISDNKQKADWEKFTKKLDLDYEKLKVQRDKNTVDKWYKEQMAEINRQKANDNGALTRARVAYLKAQAQMLGATETVVKEYDDDGNVIKPTKRKQ